MKMKANPENLAYSCVVNPEYKGPFNNKPGTIPTLGVRLQPHLEDMEVKLDAISVVRPPECPPWLLQQPNILFNLSDLRRGDTCPLVFQSMLLELFCRFPRHRKVYTDESKEDKRTAMAFDCDDHQFSCRINDEASICTAELLAIGIIASSSTFRPHPGRVIRDLFRLLDAVTALYGSTILQQSSKGSCSLLVSGYNLRADCQWLTLVPPLNSGANAAPASVLELM